MPSGAAQCTQHQAIDNVEAALLRVVLKPTASPEPAEQIAKLLREFDVVTGLSGWSDPHKVH